MGVPKKNTIYATLTGTAEMERKLRLVEQNVRKKVVGAALRKAAKPLIEAARRNAKVAAPGGKRYGGLSRSIGSVIRNYQRVILCVIGPMKDREYTREGKKEVPAKIAHLVEFGHRIAVGGQLQPLVPKGWTPELVWSRVQKTMVFKHGAPRRLRAGKPVGKQKGTVPGYPFMRPAWDSQRATAQSVFEQEFSAGIEAALT